MADICMCTGDCPVKEYCYRYMAEPNKYGQSYSKLESVCIPNGYSELIFYKKSIDKFLQMCAIDDNNSELYDSLLPKIYQN